MPSIEDGPASDGDEPDRSYEAATARLNMPIVEAMTTQRSIRRILPDPVDDRIVLELVELATRAPTGSNAQNWEFVIVKDPDVKRELQHWYRQAWAIYGRLGRALRRGDDATARTMHAVEWQIEHFDETPVIIVPCLRGTRVPFVPTPPVAASSYYGSIFPSIQNILLGARAMGLGAGLVTLPLWSTTQARRLLGLPLSVLPCALIPIGWPIGKYGPSERRPVREVAHLDRYGQRPWLDEGAE